MASTAAVRHVPRHIWSRLLVMVTTRGGDPFMERTRWGLGDAGSVGVGWWRCCVAEACNRSAYRSLRLTRGPGLPGLPGRFGPKRTTRPSVADRARVIVRYLRMFALDRGRPGTLITDRQEGFSEAPMAAFLLSEWRDVLYLIATVGLIVAVSGGNATAGDGVP